MTTQRSDQTLKNHLKQLGVTEYGLLKMNIKRLPKVLHDGEEVHGVVYGRSDDGSAMLVATSTRILYMVHRPLYETVDEISYTTVNGIKVSLTSIFVSITLHTRVRDFRIKYANGKCANVFAEYIEKRCLWWQGYHLHLAYGRL